MYSKTSSGAYRMMRDLMRMADAFDDFIVRVSADDFADDPVRSRRFSYLENAGYIKRLSSESFQLTDLAKINLLHDIVVHREPDGKKRVIVYDIPTRLNQHRDMFRRQLKEMGFEMLQRSVWVSDRPCEDLVHLLMKYHGLGKYVLLMIGEIATPKSAIADFGIKKRRLGKKVGSKRVSSKKSKQKV